MDNTKPPRTKDHTKQPIAQHLAKKEPSGGAYPPTNFQRPYHEQSIYDLQQNPHFDGIIYEDEDDCESFDSMETVSDNIPVWVHGEQRWISGVNDSTTCADLVTALLADEGAPSGLLGPNPPTGQAANTMAKSTMTTARTKHNSKGCYAITERWKRSEHIIPDDTKVLQMLSAWGRAKKEPKLTLRQIDPQKLTSWTNSSNDKDSGMSSPIGSSSSAIIRRRKHRASKSTTAWLTEAHTIHPKSHRATIDKLMKLILVQGETIQQQLAKLRDRELQIAKIEEERHKIREKEIGKNYLLETYLNGLHEADEKEIVTEHSDSGVQTDAGGVLIGNHPHPDPDNYIPTKEKKSTTAKEKRKKKDDPASSSPTAGIPAEAYEEDLVEKIEWMEKLVAINKHLQHEEELMVRLGAKIRKHEPKPATANEHQIIDDLVKVNANIESNSTEMKRIEDDLQMSNEQLREKIDILERLSREFVESDQSQPPISTAVDIEIDANRLPLPQPLPLPPLANFPQDLYHLSQYISKPNYDFNENNENLNRKSLNPKPALLSTPSPNPIASATPPNGVKYAILPPPHAFANENLPQLFPIPVSHPKISQAPIVNCKNKNPICMPINPPGAANPSAAVAAVNFYQKNSSDPPLRVLAATDTTAIDNQNLYASPSGRAMGKLGPKRLINGAFNEFESNSDTGMSSMGDDITQLGTLV